MLKKIPIGISDFRELRETGCEYIDKTNLITEFIDQGGVKVLLLPRPRRFGKTINLSMLRWFFEKREENLWHLFEGLHVARAGEKYRAHFQQYPVIFISFRGTKANTFAECWAKIKSIIQEQYKEHGPSVEGRLAAVDEAEFRDILLGTAPDEMYGLALYRLCRYLRIAHKKPPIILIDEYDAPIHSGYTQGYYQEVVGFFRSFLESALKDNPHLERAVLTGILRVSKESIFSGLNNIAVYSLLERNFSTCFGFTEPEVDVLLEKGGLTQLKEAVRSYYDGYEFGGHSIYNPWSILSFLNSQSKQLQPYWINTSANDLVKDLLVWHAFAVQDDIQALLMGESIEKDLNENIVFTELKDDSSELWSLLVFTGYLKATSGPIVIGARRKPFWLSIPNEEVDQVYRTTFQSWMKKGLQVQGGALEALLAALLAGKVPEFEAQLQAFAMYCTSFHDLNAHSPERFYHGLMIGLLAALEPAYEVRSNRESGEGRPDVLIKPRRPGKPGVVMELKSAGPKKSLRRALDEGHAQLHKNDYLAELRAAGVEKMHALVIAFNGKKVRVELAKPPPKKSRKRGAQKTTPKVTRTQSTKRSTSRR